ncbi:hypothetical protein [Parafrankia sp. EUN1f]|uniref:hypothetical protein n=1 Tax=Parafrankia sp. EUN1f TaxID=102897 RepID=UPI0001C4634A|nr:hypothetical protein [Parafrankia sp. EUN1f]EFC81486.1 hypothetical protein FrEUN1fDRAFT_5373 [Parafrankia sp. EUN1f]
MAERASDPGAKALDVGAPRPGQAAAKGPLVDAASALRCAHEWLVTEPPHANEITVMADRLCVGPRLRPQRDLDGAVTTPLSAEQTAPEELRHSPRAHTLAWVLLDASRLVPVSSVVSLSATIRRSLLRHTALTGYKE